MRCAELPEGLKAASSCIAFGQQSLDRFLIADLHLSASKHAAKEQPAIRCEKRFVLSE
jgi:hypothetical protein